MTVKLKQFGNISVINTLFIITVSSPNVEKEFSGSRLFAYYEEISLWLIL